MAVPGSPGTAVGPAATIPDVLGEDERDGRRPWTAVAAALALVAAAVVTTRTSDEPAPSPHLALSPSSMVVPRTGGPRPDGRLHVGLQLDLGNASPETVLLVRAELVPGAWQVELVDDTDVPASSERGRLLRPGWAASLVAHRLLDCTGDPDPGPAPRELVLHLERAGRALVERIDPASVGGLYEGALDEALRHPEAACPGAVQAGPWAPPHLELRLPASR